MDLSFGKVTDRAVDALECGWLEQLDGLGDERGHLLASVQRFVSWCRSDLSSGDHSSLYLIHQDGVNTPRALVELNDAQRAKDPSLKFMNIYVEPNLLLEYKDVLKRKDIEDLSQVFGYAMQASMKEAIKLGVNKLKIYGRNDDMIALFDTIVVDAPDDLDIYRQGKWLVIEV